jgi:K+-transporting ATPase KdpF subunit
VDADYEVDLYAGFSSTFGESGPSWEAGLVYYTYEESDYNYPELYASLSKDWFKAKLSYSNDFGGDTTAGDTPAFYLEGNATVPLPNNFSLLGHVGYSFGDYWDDLDEAGTGGEYFDYSLAVGYTAGHFNLALKWLDGSDLKEADGTPDDVFFSDHVAANWRSVVAPKLGDARMSTMDWIGLLLSLAIAVYHIVALLRPEKFE